MRKIKPFNIIILVVSFSFLAVCIYLSFLSPSWGFGKRDAQANKVVSSISITQEELRITKEQYDKVETGMTEKQMFKILGGKGEILSQSDVGYGEFKVKTVMYLYYGKGEIGANANFTVQNGKVISKAQFGLK